MTTEKTYNMRQPDGIMVRSKVVFDKRTFGIQNTNRTPLIDAPADKKVCRVLAKDALWSPRHKNTLNAVNRNTGQAEIPAFSVINKVLRQGQNKYDFFRDYWFVGLSTGVMEWEAIKTNADIRSAVDIQGQTPMHNNGLVLIRAGDKIMMDMDESTEAAERRMNGLPRPQGTGEVPEKRYTTYPAVWNIEQARDGILEDWGRMLRGNGHKFPSTPNALIELRRMISVGVILGLAYQDPNNSPANAAALIQRLSTILQNPGGEMIDPLLTVIRNGDLDLSIAALLTPQDGERIIGGPRVPRNTLMNVKYVHSMQMHGLDNWARVVDTAIGDAGRNRVIGTALTNGNPGDQFGINLTG